MNKDDLHTISEMLSAIAWLHAALSKYPDREWLLVPARERYDAGRALLIRLTEESNAGD